SDLTMGQNKGFSLKNLNHYEFQFKKTGKQIGWAKAIISPIPKSKMFLVTFEDITSKNKLYELEQKKFKEISIINKISKLQIKTTDSKTFIRNFLAIIHGELGLNSSAIIVYQEKKVVSKEFLGKSDFVKKLLNEPSTIKLPQKNEKRFSLFDEVNNEINCYSFELGARHFGLSLIQANHQTGHAGVEDIMRVAMKEFKASFESLILSEEAEKKEVELQTIFQSIEDGLIVTDDRDTIRKINGSAKKYLKINGNPVGKSIKSIIPESLYRQLYVDNLNKKGESHSIKNIEFCYLESSFRCYKFTLSNVLGKNNLEAGKVLSIHNTTKEKKLQKMKSDFVSTVSHELRTPLTSILGYSKTLLRSGVSFTDKDKNGFIKTIINEGERLSNLVEDLLDLSKIENGKLNVEKKPVDSLKIIKSEIAYIKDTFPKHIFVLKVIPGLPLILAEEEKLSRVFINILSNATKYSPDGGKVIISAYKKSNTVEFSIEDEGIGVREDEIEHIFQPFFRTEESMKRTIRGTGLGLSIIKEIIEKFNGKICIKSKPGKGTTFFFELPMA
ncbi:MAG: GHKL domain-containing protein, partial [Actinomycetia bacterium]|nr:GHKL domain-containing protein [Actinomycetes bacterium]